MIISLSLNDFSTFSYFKEVVLNEISNENPDYIPSRQYFNDLLKRLSQDKLII